MMKFPKETVMEYIKALATKDFASARALMKDVLPIMGPGETFHDPDILINIIRDSESDYNVKKVFVDGKEVCVLYELTTKKPPAKVFTCSWYKVDEGKIASIHTIFDTAAFKQGNK